MSFIEIANTDRPQWLIWRHNGIGSSDASAIMGVSRFQNYDQLLGKKALPMPIEETDNGYIKDRGNKIEAIVRRLFEEQVGVEMPAMSCQSSEFSYMLATLDGIDAKRTMITEIKLLATVNPDKPNFETEGCKKWEATKKGIIPKDYYPQVQHQLAVTGADMCVFLGLREMKRRKIEWSDIAMTAVFPDPDYLKELITKETEFWHKVLKLRAEYAKLNITGGVNETNGTTSIAGC